MNEAWIGPALAVNAGAPRDLLLALAATEDRATQLALVRRLQHPDRFNPQLALVLADSPDRWVKAELIETRQLSDEVIIRLARDADPRVRELVASRPEIGDTLPRYAPDEAYRTLALDPDPEVRAALVVNPKVPRHIKLLMADDARLRDHVLLEAADEFQASDAYRRLLTHAKPAMRLYAISHRRFRPPAELVEALLADAEIRDRAISRIPLTAERAIELAKHPDPLVRHAVALNPDLTATHLTTLAHDPDPGVREALLRRPHVPPDVLELVDFELPEDSRAVVRASWLHEETEPERLVRYARSRHVMFRRGVAAIEGLPMSLVNLLADDEDFGVRLLLTENNSDKVPLRLIREMMWNWHGYSTGLMAHNPRISDELIEQLSRSPDRLHRWHAVYTHRLTPEQQKRLANDPDPILAREVRWDMQTVAELVQRLDDPEQEVRSRAASSGRLPVDVMWRLYRRWRSATVKDQE